MAWPPAAFVRRTVNEGLGHGGGVGIRFRRADPGQGRGPDGLAYPLFALQPEQLRSRLLRSLRLPRAPIQAERDLRSPQLAARSNVLELRGREREVGRERICPPARH